MAKERVTCRDCPCCENLPGSKIALCWRPYDGPQVIDATTTGFCGNEWIDETGEAPDGMTPRELWLAGHGHSREKLANVLTLLRLGGAGATLGSVGEAVQLLHRVLERQGCNTTCAHGGYPDCEKEAGLVCGSMLRAREIWAVICLLRGEGKAG